MTTPHQRTTARRKLLLALLIGLACGVIAHGQEYVASYTPSTDTNAAPVVSFNLWYQQPNASDTNRWFWLGESTGTNISFAAPAINPALLSVTANDITNQSAYSETYLFDTNNFVVAKQLKLFPPRFLKITRKPN